MVQLPIDQLDFVTIIYTFTDQLFEKVDDSLFEFFSNNQNFRTLGV